MKEQKKTLKSHQIHNSYVHVFFCIFFSPLFRKYDSLQYFSAYNSLIDHCRTEKPQKIQDDPACVLLSHTPK